jgi:hypothetical protein
VVRAVGKVKNEFAPSGIKGHKIFVFDGQPTTIRQLNAERAKRLSMQRLANSVDLHTDFIRQIEPVRKTRGEGHSL